VNFPAKREKNKHVLILVGTFQDYFSHACQATVRKPIPHIAHTVAVHLQTNLHT